MAEFYEYPKEQVFSLMESDTKGLSPKEAQDRLAQYGPNQLAENKKKSVARIFLEQFADLLVIILIAAAVISMVSGNTESTLVIFAVLLLNAVLGTVQTVKAEKSLAALKAMAAPKTKVLRSGIVLEIPSAEVVPGDIMILEAGDLVAADGRIVENYVLKVDESSLTGESDAVEKTSKAIEGDRVALGDRRNMVHSGSLATYGRAHVLVTATGMSTELGKIALLMNETKQRKTPLQVSLDRFSGKLAIAVIGVCILVFLLSIFRSHMSILDSLMFAVALAVAAIPEALGSIVTIVLAIGTQKMAKQNAIIKDLKAVESLGCVSVICSDKTGTLTQNKMTVTNLYADGCLFDVDEIDMNNVAHCSLVHIGVLASDAVTDEETGRIIGDPTEAALVRVGKIAGINEASFRGQYPRLGEVAFDSERKMMSTLHLWGDEVPTMMTKGAIDSLLVRCDHILTSSGVAVLNEAAKERILAVNDKLSREGLRVLAFAQREINAVYELSVDDEEHFTFVGLVAMMDPPREESIASVADAATGGIRTVMITGDHKITAAAIAKRIGILKDGDLAVDGVELDRMSDEELDGKLKDISVYARVSPEHKIRIVSAWQRQGSIVSMTGDGVNDAPALKRADIGVAMGITGTEVSKDASSMILVDDNFATIVKAVINGRGIYANIKHSIQFLLSGNMAGILCVLFASLMGLPAPFEPVHLLFINLLTDSLPAIAIGMEPAKSGLLQQKPRDPKEPILDRWLLSRVINQGSLIAIPTMAAFYIGYDVSVAAGATMAFAVLTLARLFHGFNCRSRESLLRLGFRSNPFSLLAFFGGVLLLSAALFVPGLNDLFMISGLTASKVGLIVLLAFAPTFVIQTVKMIKERYV
ncbi:MAG TPA: cation-translocating P-type ATPase [Clostridiales bacterium]|nr:cation-translocating P-type ATPase [Clostridiales bacterium]